MSNSAPIPSFSSQPKRKPFKLQIIAISSFLGFIVLLSLLIYLSVGSHRKTHPHSQLSPAALSSLSTKISEACKATRSPKSCETSLKNSSLIPPHANPLQIVQLALAVSSNNLDIAESMVQDILTNSAGDPNRTTAAEICLETLGYSEYRLNLSAEGLSRDRMKDARAWTSAALSYQYDCWSGFKKVNDSQMVVDTMSFMNDTLIPSTSNALSMMMSYDEFGNETGSWAPPKTERDGFWETVVGGSGSDLEPGVPTDLKENVTVCKDDAGGCTYKTVQAAVDAAPENLDGGGRFVIRIKAGVYEEIVRIPLEKRNVVFLGDGMGKTVITGSLHVGQPGVSTYNTPTVGVFGDGFMAKDLTIQNTAGLGPDAHQAVAFRSDSDLSILENCEFKGNQDTLYVHSLRQFYKSCTIEGNIDFIFGNSASFFKNCTILIQSRQTEPEKGETNVITAHGRTDPVQTTGFFFHDCLVTGTNDYKKLYFKKPSVHQNFLGRPWKEFSRTVFLNCILDALISPVGWMPWDGNFALNTLYYGEFDNSGLGSNFSSRVSWSNQITADHVKSYSVQNFIEGDEWMLT